MLLIFAGCSVQDNQYRCWQYCFVYVCFDSLKCIQYRIDFLRAIYAGVYVQCCVCKTDANIVAGNIAQTSKPGIGS